MTLAEDLGARAGIALEARGLSKHYRGLKALDDCTFTLPAGGVVALVGANGAGKSTLMSIISGMLKPTSGEFRVGGDGPAGSRVVLLSQDKPLYRNFSVTDMLNFGRHTNHVWDQHRALSWLERFHIPVDRRCDKLSGGQQAQVALAVALGACPSLLLLDEPLANLDPVARNAVTGELLGEVAETGMTVVLSTHVVAELAGVGDYLLLLSHGRNIVDSDVEELLARHARVTGPRADRPPLDGTVVHEHHTDRQSTFVVRTLLGPATHIDVPGWTSHSVSLEDIVLAYLKTSIGEVGL
ncbi:ABC transporter ATP-binding protein [Kitasatospora aureofaciens]|uniref:ABC transporter ATP-binding protein n=1 Tax=Kitasatospora aureofaciens TaxID=1894 RepID=UPI001C464952|nr:ABC transporter ATP-binding protein [Kitasatospora aureofaciens]MBV6702015.1 ABC transporter ATP-binding protein [Kitasatospora aureofaciens]